VNQAPFMRLIFEQASSEKFNSIRCVSSKCNLASKQSQRSNRAARVSPLLLEAVRHYGRIGIARAERRQRHDDRRVDGGRRDRRVEVHDERERLGGDAGRRAKCVGQAPGDDARDRRVDARGAVAPLAVISKPEMKVVRLGAPGGVATAGAAATFPDAAVTGKVCGCVCAPLRVTGSEASTSMAPMSAFLMSIDVLQCGGN
jgi:hypothetical protein